MGKIILAIVLIQVLFTSGNNLEMQDNNCATCDIVLSETLPDTFKICVHTETRCTTLGKLRQTVK